MANKCLSVKGYTMSNTITFFGSTIKIIADDTTQR